MKKLYAYTLGTIIGLMPIIMIASYFTYTEKTVMPIALIIMTICAVKIRKEK